ncbi:hypothetical protein ACVWWO_004579 [Bradyrhizobium sp. F1.13.1]
MLFLVLGRELVAGIELHAERSDVSTEVQHRRRELGAFVAHRELGIRQVTLVAVGIAEVLADLADHVQLVRGQIVADPVAGILGEPELAGARIDVAADRVANAERVDFRIAGLGIDAADLRDAGRGHADVEGRSERNVEPAFLVDRDVLPAMRGIGRHVVIDDLALAGIVELVLDVVVADQLVDRDDVERTVLDGQTRGHVQPLEDGLDLFLSVVVLDRVNVAEAERADEQRALVTPGHLPRGQHAGGVDLHLEARWQLHLLDDIGEFGVGGAGRRPRRRRQALLRLGLVAEEPVVRRMGPELLGAGFVFLQRLVLVLLLRVTDACPREKGNRCKRQDGLKDGSMEFHRVTPLRQPSGLHIYFILLSRGEVRTLSRGQTQKG